jgi:hypothetical protein
MSNIKKAAWLLAAIPFAFVIAVPSKAPAIPYFARKYKTTCSRCHMAVPKLNTFGKNFQLHGYQQPGDKDLNKITFPEDPNLTVIDQPPVAFLMENQVQADKSNGNRTAVNLSSPYVFHIFASDTFAPDLGFFGELADQGGVTDIGKVSLIASHLGNQNIFLNVGNLDVTEHGVTEHDLYGRSGYGVQDIGLASAGVGQGFILSSQHMGARVYGLIGASVTPDLIHGKQSTGEEDQAKKADNSSVRPLKMQKSKKDDDDMKEEADPMDQLKGFLWEVGMYNSTNLSPTADNPNPNDYSARLNAYFSGDSFVGVQAYSGLMNVGTGVANRFRFAGPDFSYYFGKPIEKSKGMMVKPFNLLGGYMTGQADNPNDDGNRVSWNGYYLELNYAVSPRSMCFLRYDKVNSNNLGALQTTVTDAVTANYTYYLRTNFWLGLEYTQDLTSAKQNMLGFLFNFAF